MNVLIKIAQTITFKQHYEKLIPTIIKNALAHKPIPIYGDGKNVRDWLYVLDHCKALDKIYHEGAFGETITLAAITAGQY